MARSAMHEPARPRGPRAGSRRCRSTPCSRCRAGRRGAPPPRGARRFACSCSRRRPDRGGRPARGGGWARRDVDTRCTGPRCATPSTGAVEAFHAALGAEARDDADAVVVRGAGGKASTLRVRRRHRGACATAAAPTPTSSITGRLARLEKFPAAHGRRGSRLRSAAGAVSPACDLRVAGTSSCLASLRGRPRHMAAAGGTRRSSLRRRPQHAPLASSSPARSWTRRKCCVSGSSDHVPLTTPVRVILSK